jgi:hypothetical protein
MCITVLPKARWCRVDSVSGPSILNGRTVINASKFRQTLSLSTGRSGLSEGGFMHRIYVRFLITVLASTAAGFSAQAQTAPPIKPGLWQIHSEREVNGQKQPDASERMKSMSP